MFKLGRFLAPPMRYSERVVVRQRWELIQDGTLPIMNETFLNTKEPIRIEVLE